jgi:FKBP-type peptidyl-prolyl cis-trans isomerase FkpA
MKKTLVAIAALTFILASCSTQGKEKAAEGSEKGDVSYAFGYAVGSSIVPTGVEIDYDSFLAGMKDFIEKKDGKMSLEEAQIAIQGAIMEAMQKLAEKNAAAEVAFLAENGKKPGVKTTASGLQYEAIKEGTGPKPIETDMVKVDYVGTFIDGSKFDSSIDSGQPAVFPVGQVIPGWVEAIQLMSVGSKYKLYIPSALAYGAEGSQGGIAPNSLLIFEVDLLSIEPSPGK